MVDIDQRVEIVNMRLDVVRELLEILRAELSEQHGTRLEVHRITASSISHELQWVVIWLIVVEVVLGLSALALQVLMVWS